MKGKTKNGVEFSINESFLIGNFYKREAIIVIKNDELKSVNLDRYYIIDMDSIKNITQNKDGTKTIVVKDFKAIFEK